MTQSAQLHRQMRSIPLCSKAVFYVFVFDYIHDSSTMHNLSPRLFHEPKSACVGRWCGDVFADMLKSAKCSDLLVIILGFFRNFVVRIKEVRTESSGFDILK